MDFRLLGIPFSGKQQPTLTPAIASAAKRKRGDEEQTHEATASVPSSRPQAMGVSGIPPIPTTGMGTPTGSTSRPEVSNPSLELTKRLAREYGIPLTVVRAILMTVVPDPSECVDLRATGAMAEYNGADSKSKSALASELHHRFPSIVSATFIREQKLRLMSPAEVKVWRESKELPAGEGFSSGASLNAPDNTRTITAPPTLQVASPAGPRPAPDIQRSEVKGFAEYERDTTLDMARGVTTRTGSEGLGGALAPTASSSAYAAKPRSRGSRGSGDASSLETAGLTLGRALGGDHSIS